MIKPSERKPAAPQPSDPNLISLEALERRHIAYVIARTKTLKEAAFVLGVNMSTLWRKRKNYGLLSRAATVEFILTLHRSCDTFRRGD